MFLDATVVPELYRVLTSEKPNALEDAAGASASLTAAMSLALFAKEREIKGQEYVSQIVKKLNLPGVQAAAQCIDDVDKKSRRKTSGNPAFELFCIRSQADVITEDWVFFYDRFRQSASGRRKSDMFRSVGGVLGEIGDNVPSHAYADAGKPCVALAGFHVSEGSAAFCVCDLGQGFLTSLRRDVRWNHLRSDQEALDAVVNQQATSRVGEKTGGGFKQLFGMLLGFNGLVIIRSGGCLFKLINEGHTKKLVARSTTTTPGSSVTVVISPDRLPREAELPFSV